MDDDQQPESAALKEHLTERALKHRAYCGEQIERHRDAMEFWMKEHEVITSFLAEDYFSQPTPDRPRMEDKTPEDSRFAKYSDKEMKERLQGRR